MIKAAGMGTRLRSFTNTIPKPMVPIVNKPVMEYCVKHLKNHGIANIITNTHYLPESINELFTKLVDLGERIYGYETAD